MSALTEISLPSFQKIASGKVRDLFELPDKNTLLFVASDRVSAYDAVLKNAIPDKGKILTLLSAHWFQVLTERIPDLRTHFLSLDVPEGVSAEEAQIIKNRSMVVKKLSVIKIESIVYGLPSCIRSAFQSHFGCEMAHTARALYGHQDTNILTGEAI
jgi:phosphoribosylaminoimidazole-succinocarboxamide synthase